MPPAPTAGASCPGSTFSTPSPSGRSPTAGTSSCARPPSRMPEPAPAQTVGPFFAIGLPWDDGPDVLARDAPGAIVLRGTVYDGEREPVPDALVETWQTPDGCRGFGRCPTDAAGRWEIVTRKPASAGGGAPRHAG